MNKYRTLLTFVFFISFFIINAQKTDSDSLIRQIKNKGIEFLKEKGEFKLSSNVSVKSSEQLFIVELLERKEIGYNNVGIYRVGIFRSHTNIYILLKCKNKYHFLDVNNLNKTIKKVINFLERNNISSDKSAEYLEKVIQTYRNNKSSIRTVTN